VGNQTYRSICVEGAEPEVLTAALASIWPEPGSVADLVWQGYPQFLGSVFHRPRRTGFGFSPSMKDWVARSDGSPPRLKLGTKIDSRVFTLG
jgi:hypothetical protein